MYRILIPFLVVLILSCSKEKQGKTQIFKTLEASETGISFANMLTENDSVNYFTYAYIYMGGGVAAGDFNNDGLTDLYFTGNMVSNKLYLNQGGLKFEDITDKAGVGGDSRWYTGVTVVDINHDGFLDIYCSVGGKYGSKENQLFVNNGDNTFTEKAAEYGIADVGNSVQATFFDYDLDGDLDMYLANYPPTRFDAPNHFYNFKQQFPKENEIDKLYRNDGSSFTDVTEEAGLKTFGLSLSATVGDLNNDGWPDIYISNDFSTPDYLFINQQDGTFSEEVRRVTKNTSFYGMGVDIADFNNDALLDILQVDMTAKNNRRSKSNMASMNPDLFWSTVNYGFHFQYMQNSLQMNNGMLNDSLPDFSNIARLAGISSTDWSWGPLLADLDNDGWKDIFVSNGTRREINNRDYFIAWEAEGRPTDSLLKRSLAIPSEKIDNFVFKNLGNLKFEQVNEDWGIQFKGFSNGGVYADLDNDGDLEIVINNIDDKALIFENNSSELKNHLRLAFKGPEKNPFGIGVRVSLENDSLKQLQELTLTRGFQSAVAPNMHFGVGKEQNIASLKVRWPDGKTEILENVAVNQSLTIDYKNAKEGAIEVVKSNNSQIFATEKDSTLIVNHLHQENNYDDYYKEVLLPHATSMLGPYIASGDLNGDGLDDFVVGASLKEKTAIYFQTALGFQRQEAAAMDASVFQEDGGIHIFDAEGDGDLDIYVASAGNEFEADSPLLQDRLYVNNGSGRFRMAPGALPEMITSSSRVHSFDYDKDGDLDLFIGGRLVPGSYPSPADSYILENVSVDNEPKFLDATEKVAPELRELGMVTDAKWTDYDQDGWTDLILVGEWMPITVLKNNKGRFENTTKSFGLEDSTGWWFSIEEGDFDNDGDMDYLVGNLGLNYKYKASEEETFDVYFNDFDASGTKDIVLSYFNEGQKFPLRGRECSSQQMPAIKKKFENYASFSTATLEDVYTEEYLENSLHYQVKSFASIYLENKDGKLLKHMLPIEAQLSSINRIVVDDFDKDGKLDAVIVGNLHGSEVETPRNDASNGLFLKGNGQGQFDPIPGYDSGLFAKGDIKDLTVLNIKGQRYFAISKNSNYLQFVRVANPKEDTSLALSTTE